MQDPETAGSEIYARRVARAFSAQTELALLEGLMFAIITAFGAVFALG
jgi:hypothetical protein